MIDVFVAGVNSTDEKNPEKNQYQKYRNNQ